MESYYDEKMSRQANPPPYSSDPQAPGPQPSVAYPPPPQIAVAQHGVVVSQPVIVGGPMVGVGVGRVGYVGGVGVPVMISQQMGPRPARYSCKSCQAQIVTRVEQKSTLRTHLFAVGLCVIGCWPCACIPYCMDSCKNADHYCPNCNAYIGSHVS